METLDTSPGDAGAILVAGADRAQGARLARHLRAAGYRVLEAVGGRAALARARATRPVLAILGLALPDMSGLAVCDALRREQDLPVIVLSGRAPAEARADALDLGADDVVGEPFTVAELLLRVRAVLRRSGRAAAGRVAPESREAAVALTHRLGLGAYGLAGTLGTPPLTPP